MRGCFANKNTKILRIQRKHVRYVWGKKKKRTKCPRDKKIQMSKKKVVSIDIKGGKRKRKEKDESKKKTAPPYPKKKISKDQKVIYTTVFVVHSNQLGTNEQHPCKP